jgi:hypothetical protein
MIEATTIKRYLAVIIEVWQIISLLGIVVTDETQNN